MKVDATGKLKIRIAIVAKYTFYYEDICCELSDLDIQIVFATEISQIQEHVENGVNFEFIFFPHYSKLVPINFLEKSNCIGFHTGDLPEDRGGSPIQNKILRGEYSTWISALKLIEELDGGNIFCREKISIEYGSIEVILRGISKVIARLIRIIVIENPIPVPQTGHTSISPRLKPDESELKFDGLEVKQIYDRIRMLDGLDYPPAYIQIDRYRILLSNAELRGNDLTFVSRLEDKK